MADIKGIPAWQRKAAADSTQPATQDQDASPSVMDQVREFLEDPQVKDAPVEKKRAFLLSKNVSEDMINQVMGSDSSLTPTDTDGSTEAAKQEFDASKKIPQGPSHVNTTDGSEIAAKQEYDATKVVATPSAVFNLSEFKATTASTTSSAQQQQPLRDVPPIVTYPEFLVQPQKPPPLVTVNRLVDTAYAAGALTATIYALSKYIVAPMSENLNEARHDLAQHTNDHVQDFNERLSKLVSTIPASAKPQTLTPDDSDAESTFSDPTELFHRDMGTQTSPSLSRRPSASSSDAGPDKLKAVVAKHTARLSTLRSHLSDILSDDKDNGTINQSLQKGIGEVRHYVDSLYYSPPAYQYQQADNVWNSSSTPKSDKPDAAASFKTEIRGVKGVLLNAKRFPSAAAKAGA